MLRGGLGQSEGAPVCVAADYAAGPEDLDTSITRNSSIWLVILGRFLPQHRIDRWLEKRERTAK